MTMLAEGNIVIDTQGREVVNINAFDGIDNDLDGLIDENYYLHYRQRRIDQFGTVLFDILNPRAHIDYYVDDGTNINLMIDERRDDGIDNDDDWVSEFDDLGADGISDTYDFGEGDGKPTSGEPNFDQTDVDESDQIGLTSFDYFVPANQYPMRDDEALWDKLRPGFFDTPSSIVDGKPIQGEDGDFIYGSAYFPLRAGQTERLSIALVYGKDLDDLINNKRIVQNIYNNDYRFPPPPQKPELQSVAGDGQVTLYWNRIAETSVDPITKKKDFQGYKLYRATDPDFNDVRNITNAHGLVEGYIPLMQWDIDDEIEGYFYPSKELFQQTQGYSYFLGDNTGLVHSFVDNDVVNGRTYYYALVAYDSGDEAQSIFPAENTKFISVLPSGETITDKNTNIVIPTSKSAGYSIDENIPIDHTTGIGTGSVVVEVLDDKKLNGHEYLVEFLDTSSDGIDNDGDWDITFDDLDEDGIADSGEPNVDQNDESEFPPVTTYYSIKDLTPVTVTFIPNDTLPVQLPYQNIIIESVTVKNSVGSIISNDDYVLISATGKIFASAPGSLGNDEHSITFNHYPIYNDPHLQNSPWTHSEWLPYAPETKDTRAFDGIRLNFSNDWVISPSDTLSFWLTTDDGISWSKDDADNTHLFSVGTQNLDLNFDGNIDLFALRMPSDYVISFSDEVGYGQSLSTSTFPTPTPGEPTNFRVFDKTHNREVPFLFYDQSLGRKGILDPLDIIYFYEKDEKDRYHYSWSVIFTLRQSHEEGLQLNYGDGDSLFIATSKPFRKQDTFTFTTPVPAVTEDQIKVSMDDIKVVPNPYIAATEFEAPLPPGITSGRGERLVFFQNIPSDAKIHIFTSRGQHLRTLKHTGDIFNGTVTWDLKTKENLDVAYGVYFYVVDSPSGGKHSGKLAVIK
jgi:hypothetical protein